MKKQKFLFPVLILICGLLTGCAKETDLSARFPEYMKYAFGEDYRTECIKDSEGKNADKWQFYYHDHTGASCEIKGGFSIFPYDMRSDTLKEWSKEQYYTLQMNRVAVYTMADIAVSEVEEQVFKPHFPAYNGKNAQDGNLGGAKLSHSAMLVLDFFLNADLEDYPLLQQWVTPDTGFQVCTADWKTVANSTAWYYFVTVDIDEGEEPQPYIAQMKAALSDYQKQAGAAQNYDFCIKQRSSGKNNILWEEAVIHGKTADPRNYNNDVAEAYREQMKGKE